MLTVTVFIGIFLGWRAALVVGLAVPICYGITLILDLYAGYTINRVTLFALILALGLPAGAFAASFLLHPRRYDPVKMGPYECGIEPTSDARERYSIRYYVIAVLFVVFDVETIFLFPWAVQYKVLRLFGFVEMVVFLGILFVGWWYVVAKGALDWSPSRRGASRP